MGIKLTGRPSADGFEIVGNREGLPRLARRSTVESPVGYLKAVLVALVGGVLLAAAVLAVEMVHAESVMALQMTNCHTNVGSDRSDTVCDAATQVGGVELPLAFGFGFAATFAWFLRDRDGPLRGQRLGRFM